MTAWIRERCVYAPTLTPRWLVDLRRAERLPYPPQIASHVGVSVSSAVPSRAALCYLAAAWRADTLFCCMAAQQQNQKPHGFKCIPSKKHSRGSVRPARTATACKAGYQPGSAIAPSYATLGQIVAPAQKPRCVQGDGLHIDRPRMGAWWWVKRDLGLVLRHSRQVRGTGTRNEPAPELPDAAQGIIAPEYESEQLSLRQAT